jgi:hypothetical protein
VFSQDATSDDDTPSELEQGLARSLEEIRELKASISLDIGRRDDLIRELNGKYEVGLFLLQSHCIYLTYVVGCRW